jgi:hypothetical protein
MSLRRVAGLLRIAPAVLAAAAALASQAQGLDPTPPATEAPAPRDRFETIRQMTEPELKRFYLGCSGSAMRARLGAGSIAECSTAYETLLTKVFGGDFHSFLQWRRGQRPGRGEVRLPEP